MMLGTWTRRLPPLPGELLTSCLSRNAYAHGLSPYRFFSLFWPGDAMWNRDFDRHPRALSRGGKVVRPDWLADIADKMQVPVAEVEAATLQGLREVLARGRIDARGDTPFLLSAGVYHRTRRCHALQFCPKCLAEGTPHYRRLWRLGFIVGCNVHDGRPLRDACPHCNAPVVPHRSMALRMTDCQACGGTLIARRRRQGGQRWLPDGSLTLQRALLALAKGEAGVRVGPWQDRAAFDGLRALVAVSSPRIVQAVLREALGLPVSPPSEGRMRFEQARITARAALLETTATWLADWPRSFHAGASGAKLTQRSFARQRMPQVLAAEVALLPKGIQRDRTWVSVLEEPVLRQLRRRDSAAYRVLRAQRILAALAR